MTKLKELIKQHKKGLEVAIGVVVAVILIISGYHIYQRQQDAQAKVAIEKVCKSTASLEGITSDFQIMDVNAHKKIVKFQMNRN